MERVPLSVHGTHLHAEWHVPEGKIQRAAVAIHGFRSSMAELGDLPARLAASGTACMAIDLRGHGESGGDRGRIDLDHALADVRAAVEAIRQRAPKARLALVGHSLGGALALGIAARMHNIEAVVAAHPVDRLIDEARPAKRVLFHAIGRMARRRTRSGGHAGHIRDRPDYHDGFVDRSLAKQAKAEGYLQDSLHLGNYTFASTMQATDWAARVQVPVLGIISPHDRTVDPAASQRVLDAVAGAVEILPHIGGHACFRDVDRERVLQGTCEFLARRLGPKPLLRLGGTA